MTARTAYELEVRDAEGGPVPLEDFAGDVLLVSVLAAGSRSFCADLAALDRLQARYAQRGLTVLALPALDLPTSRPSFAVADCSGEPVPPAGHPRAVRLAPAYANGPEAPQLLQHVKWRAPRSLLGARIKWAGTRFLLDRQGRLRRRYGPFYPDFLFEADLRVLLSEPPHDATASQALPRAE